MARITQRKTFGPGEFRRRFSVLEVDTTCAWIRLPKASDTKLQIHRCHRVKLSDCANGQRQLHTTNPPQNTRHNRIRALLSDKYYTHGRGAPAITQSECSIALKIPRSLSNAHLPHRLNNNPQVCHTSPKLPNKITAGPARKVPFNPFF